MTGLIISVNLEMIIYLILYCQCKTCQQEELLLCFGDILFDQLLITVYAVSLN